MNTLNRIPWDREPSLEELGAIPYKPVNPSVTQHTVEKRGFVSVPVDYSRPGSPTIDIFYRFMPSVGQTLADKSRPVVVVVNGGPGMASHFYRAYDYDYSGKVPAKVDYLGELSKYFRVLITDQRGTDGHSAPLDLDNPTSRLEVIARYFDSRHVARDHQEVIRAVIPDEPFFMVVQSYGGMVGMSYMTTPEITRMPKGLCFSAAAMPHGDFVKHNYQRRAKQKELNLRLKETRPDLLPKLGELRRHFEKLSFNPQHVHFLWSYLGQGEDGDWQKKLDKKIHELLAGDKGVVGAFIAEEGGSNFLNYVLSNPMFTPGQTDSTMAREAAERFPYEEEWMLDECLLLQRIGRNGTWQERAIEAMDASPHPGTPHASPEEIRRNFTRTKVLFSLAEGDIFLPLEVVRETSSLFTVPGVTTEIVLPGGHKALFLPKGAKAFYEWTQTICKA